jgi:hypothetical protein
VMRRTTSLPRITGSAEILRSRICRDPAF